MADSDKRIDGVLIPTPNDFKHAWFDISTLGRLSSGKMVGDLVAKKRKFFFTYDVLTGAEFDTLLTAINTNLFMVLQYTFNGVVYNVSVYRGGLTADEWSNEDGETIMKNVQFNLIEQ